jgi:membrane-associated phospholipid phosphatase
MLKNNWLVVVLISIWSALAVVFGIFDLEISKQVVNQNSGWAKFLEDYGMIPGLLVILSGIFVYYSHIKVKTDLWSWVIKIVFFLTTSGLFLYLLDIFFSNMQRNFVFDHLLIFIIISFIVSTLIFILIHIRKQVQDLNKVIFAKVVVSTSFFGYVICIQLIKTFWGRVRFRELDGTFSQFTPWYLPHGINGFDSFPSGHAAMGFMLLPLIILFSNRKAWQKNLLLLIILVLGFVLAFSRVIIGAHYASDVLFGSFFIIVVFQFFYKKY